MVDQELNRKIEDLQVFESQLQNFLNQRQSAQIELNEIENALEEIDNSSPDEVYKIISGAMIKTNREKVTKELGEKQKKLQMQISSMEKQEKLLEKNSSDLKKEIDELMSKSKSND